MAETGFFIERGSAMVKSEINLNANVSVFGAEQLDKVSDGYRNIRDVQQEIQSNNEKNRSMPGYNGTSAIGNSGSKSLGLYSGGMDTVQEMARLKAVIENLNRNIEKANDEISKSNEKGSAKDTFNWTSSLNQMEEAKQRAQNELKRLEAGEKDKGIEALIKDRKAQLYSRAWDYAIQGANIYNGYRTSIAGGDYLGAGANAKDQIGGTVMGIGGTLMSAGGMMAVTGVGAIPGLVVGGIGALAMGAGGILKLLAGDEKADNAEAKAYENSLPYLYAFNKRYANGGSVEQNRAEADALRGRAVELAKGTGLSTYDFLNMALQQTSYGLSKDDALGRTKMAAMWANATGADLSAIQGVLGLSSRMGKETDVDFLARARNASGLDKAQTTEFLQGLQSVIENGISNGYNKSTEDTAKNFAMFSSLSNNNPLWEGKYAAQKINTISNSIAGAVNLGDVNQVLTVSAAQKIAGNMSNDRFSALMGFGKTGTYLDAMLMAENGLTPEMFRGMGETIVGLEGNNLVARVERWKSMSGLNYKGAIELDRMYRENPNMSDAAISNKIKSMQTDKDFQSEETKKTEAINRIDSYVQKIGQSKFWDNYEKLLKLEVSQGKKAGELERKEKEQSDFEALSDSERNAMVWRAEEAGDIKTAYDTAKKIREITQKKAASALASKRYSDATDSFLVGSSFAFRYLSDDGGFYDKLTTSGKGNDHRDELFKEEVAKYAAYAGKKADKKVSENEIQKVLEQVQYDNGGWFSKGGKRFRDAYENGSETEYINALRDMLKQLFGEINLNLVD